MKEKKYKKIKHGSREYNKHLKLILEIYAPELEDCSNCGRPRHRGYLCLHCDKE